MAENSFSVTSASSCSESVLFTDHCSLITPSRLRAALALAVLLMALPGHAQDIEPRRWSHMPIGANFGGAAYAYTMGDIYLDPELRIQNAQFDLQTIAVKYIRSFEAARQVGPR